MGGEVALHRSMIALHGKKFVLTATDQPYIFEGVNVSKINIPDVLDINARPGPIVKQLQDLNAHVVISQNELSLPGSRAANQVGAISVVNVHTPPKYGRNIIPAMRISDYSIYNTATSAKEWGEPNAFVLHPPISKLPIRTSTTGDAYTLLSSLKNKGVEVVLELAKRFPDKRFIIVRSPAEPTHGLPDIEQRVAKLPNVELCPRVPPEEVYRYLKQTRILLVPSRYETYGMSAIEAAGYGIPSVHVDTPHVREGIGDAAVLIKPLDVDAAEEGIKLIENNYKKFSLNARIKAEWLAARQDTEMKQFADYIANLKKPLDSSSRKKAIITATRNYRR
jgi:glycosyltransferase involved in cell wall biosynthesis